MIGLGGYDWNDQVEEGPNYALMSFSSSSSDSDVSNDSTCSKSCLETFKLLKYQNDQLLKDLKKFELMVLGEIAIRKLKKKLEIAQKEKDGIQLNNAVPPPNTGNFMPPTTDLSFTGLDEFVNKPIIENCKAKSGEKEPKDQGVIDSGCSRHMTRNMSYPIDYEEIDRGYVAFGGNPKGGKITRKVVIKDYSMGIMIRNKARWVAQGAFLYEKIKEEVYVYQPPGFEDLDFLDRVYKVEKALYGLHQAPRAWYETLSTYLLDNGFQRGKIDKTLFIKRHKGDIFLV
nr:reverse transcriptase [Tanacetum cinerariifolium]